MGSEHRDCQHDFMASEIAYTTCRYRNLKYNLFSSLNYLFSLMEKLSCTLQNLIETILYGFKITKKNTNSKGIRSHSRIEYTLMMNTKIFSSQYQNGKSLIIRENRNLMS